MNYQHPSQSQRYQIAVLYEAEFSSGYIASIDRVPPQHRGERGSA